MSDLIPRMAGQVPDFGEADAVRLADELFGVRGTADALPGERDRNFRITAETGECYVLKIANAAESRDVLDLQNRAMEQVARGDDDGYPAACPRVRRGADGDDIVTVECGAGQSCFVRLLTWVPGRPLVDSRPHDASLLASLGQFLGWLDRRLEEFDHPAAHREFYWDLRHAGRIVAGGAPRLDPGRRALVDRFRERFEVEVVPQLTELPRSVIHGDGNDHNVLVQPHGRWGLRVTGVIDFGDMTHGCRVFEPSIAAAYALLDRADPLTAVASVVGGYHASRPLLEAELSVLHTLVCMRLCASVCIAAEQRDQAPDNVYLGVTESPAWTALERLADLHPRLAECTYREACGFEPSPRRNRVVGWLTEHREEIGPVVEASLARRRVLDLTPGSTELSGIEPDDTGAFTEAIDRLLRESGAEVAVGRYDEPRVCYAADQFRCPTDELPERRTIHLGIDLFLDPGAAVLAPVAGRVHGFADNSARLDYGPTILLEHAVDDGISFCTLYGHLSRESLDGLRQGMAVSRGQRIGTVGAPPINGDWPPHLHFQIITDLLDETSNFAGVAAPGARGVWKSLCPDPDLILGLPPDELLVRDRSVDDLVRSRDRLVGRSLSLHYEQPLKIVRGRGQFLYDECGRAYLDGVNNVCHVGHCHPRVVAAGQAQMAVLNTNTRYLHDGLVDYAERLTATLPEPLRVCLFVCSGSEANELALRMARAYTGRRGVLTVEGGYHGNTQALVDVSPYKFDGPGGGGQPSFVGQVPMPDPYRGRHRGAAAEVATRYVDDVTRAANALRESNAGLAAFICEPLLGCGGQIVPPPGWLAGSFERVRAAGGVCIADEVQIGFGRAGSHFWAFDAAGVTPDIVTMGKPMGNGHPIGAVVTTPEIADAFANGMEYFNTYGGNPVSCAIGLAVLDVIRDEELQEQARRVGTHLLDGLRALTDRQPLIGDVRGTGLFVGVELVLDRETRRPAPEHAARVVERVKDHGILLGVDGPAANVLKIKPPLVFDADDVDRLVEVLDRVLGESRLQVG